MRLVLIATTLALLAAAAPASAMTLATAQRVDALALRSDGVLIAYGARPAPRVHLLRGADPPKLVASGGAGTCTSDEAQLAASDAAVAVDLACDGGDLALTALTGEPLAPQPRSARPGGVAVSGTRVAFVERSGPTPAVVVRDLTGATPEIRIVPDVANASTVRLRLAGDHLAVVAGIPGATVALRVYDLTTGAVTTSYDSDIADFDVAADGTVALLRRDRAVPYGARLLVAQPGQAEPVGVVDCARPLGVRLGGGRVAYVARDGLELFDLATGTRVPRGRIPPVVDAGGRTTLAFDGRRLAYTVPSCGDGSDVVLDDTAGSPPARVSLGCPLSLPAQSPRVHGGRATIRVGCRSGCRALAVSIRQDGHERHFPTTAVRGVHPGPAIVTVSTERRDGVGQSLTRVVRLR